METYVKCFTPSGFNHYKTKTCKWKATECFHKDCSYAHDDEKNYCGWGIHCDNKNCGRIHLFTPLRLLPPPPEWLIKGEEPQQKVEIYEPKPFTREIQEIEQCLPNKVCVEVRRRAVGDAKRDWSKANQKSNRVILKEAQGIADDVLRVDGKTHYCKCGGKFTWLNRTTHQKTLRHQKYELQKNKTT